MPTETTSVNRFSNTGESMVNKRIEKLIQQLEKDQN